MIAAFKNIALKSFWPLLSVYGLLFLFLLYKYFMAKSVTSEKLIYEQGYAILMIPVGGILVLAFIFKLWGFNKVANLILSIPAGLILGYFILMVIMWLFVAILFIIGSK